MSDAALEARIKALRRAGRLDEACDLALAAGRIERAAQLAEDGLDHRRAASLWRRIEAWDAAERAFIAAGDDVEAGRLCLQTGRPLDALARLPGEAVMLRAIAFSQLGCTHAAAALNPALGAPDGAATLAALVAAEDAAPFASTLRQIEPEPDAPGAGWIGWQDGHLVAERQLPDRARFAQTLAVFQAGVPGVVPLVDAHPASMRITTRRVGFPLDRVVLSASPESAQRLVDRTRDVLLAAHQHGLIHGMLLPADVRVMPGDRALLDGWHRRHLGPVSGPWDALLDAATPPEIALGQPATPATDVWCLAHVLATLGYAVDPAARAPDPAARPPMIEFRPRIQ